MKYLMIIMILLLVGCSVKQVEIGKLVERPNGYTIGKIETTAYIAKRLKPETEEFMLYAVKDNIAAEEIESPRISTIGRGIAITKDGEAIICTKKCDGSLQPNKKYVITGKLEKGFKIRGQYQENYHLILEDWREI